MQRSYENVTKLTFGWLSLCPIFFHFIPHLRLVGHNNNQEDSIFILKYFYKDTKNITCNLASIRYVEVQICKFLSSFDIKIRIENVGIEPFCLISKPTYVIEEIFALSTNSLRKINNLGFNEAYPIPKTIFIFNY